MKKNHLGGGAMEMRRQVPPKSEACPEGRGVDATRRSVEVRAAPPVRPWIAPHRIAAPGRPRIANEEAAEVMVGTATGDARRPERDARLSRSDRWAPKAQNRRLPCRSWTSDDPGSNACRGSWWRPKPQTSPAVRCLRANASKAVMGIPAGAPGRGSGSPRIACPRAPCCPGSADPRVTFRRAKLRAHWPAQRARNHCEITRSERLRRLHPRADCAPMGRKSTK